MNFLKKQVQLVLVVSVFAIAFSSQAFASDLDDRWQIREGDETFVLEYHNSYGSCIEYYDFHYRGVFISGDGYFKYDDCTQKLRMVVKHGNGALIFRPIPNGTYEGKRTGQDRFYIDNVLLDGRVKTLNFSR